MLPQYYVLSLTRLRWFHLIKYLNKPLDVLFAVLFGESLLEREHFIHVFDLFLSGGPPDYEGLEQAEDCSAKSNIAICDLCQDLVVDSEAVRPATLATHNVLLVLSLSFNACLSQRFNIFCLLWLSNGSPYLYFEISI